MANNINREGFKRFLELGAPSFEGNIILDSGELSEYYYRFMRIPLAYGEHKLTIDKEDCVEAEFPKKWVKIRPPMFISEERRAILVESGKKLAALSKEKAARKAVQEKE